MSALHALGAALVAALLALALLALAAPAGATSYVMTSDATLVEQADAVVEARVVGVGFAGEGRRPMTEYTIEVEELLAGSVPGSRLSVRVLGGIGADGIGLHVYGAPRFGVDDRPLLFLVEADDGTYRLLHLMLGAFHRVETPSGELAVRHLAEATEVTVPGHAPSGDPRSHQPRHFERFSSWVADHGRGLVREADYHVAAVPGIQNLTEEFTLFTTGGRNLRWFEFDDGQSVVWRSFAGGQPGLSDGGVRAFTRALAAWTNENSTNIRLTYGGATGASQGLTGFDGENTILYGDPNNEMGGTFRCPGGGTLAIGGPWFIGSQFLPYRGAELVIILGADIVTNDGIECWFELGGCPDLRAEEVFAHELGHTLGFGHSCGDASSPACSSDATLDDALMRAQAHGDCRGGTPRLDDRRAARFLYEGAAAPAAPAAPTNLIGQVDGTRVLLDWSDNSSDETGFLVFRAMGGGGFSPLVEVAADTTSFADPTVALSTTYRYQVRSVRNGTQSGPSNTVEVTTPTPQPIGVEVIAPDDPVPFGQPVLVEAEVTGPVDRIVWDFGNRGLGLSAVRCGPNRFCREHIFLESGPMTIGALAIGDLGQEAFDSTPVTVADGPFDRVASASFVQSVLFAQRGDTGTFETNGWLHNAGDEAAAVRLTYLPRGAADPSLEPRHLTLAAGESIFLGNLVASVFDVASGQGSLLVEHLRAPDAVGESRVFTITRSFVAEGGFSLGSFGQFVGAQAESTWNADGKTVTGVLEGDGFVSTLLAANVDEVGGAVDVRLFDAVGDEVGSSQRFALGPRTIRFRRIADLFPEAAERSGPFTARFTSTGVRFLASSTLLETESEDQIFLPAGGPPTTGELIVPRITRGAGQFGVDLVSRLTVHNDSTAPTTLTFELLARGQDNTDPQEALRTVAPGETLAVTNVVGELFGLETATGALRVTWTNAEGDAPRVVSLALATNPRGERFGMAVGARAVEEASNRAVDFGAERSPVFQASYGAVNLSSGPVRLRLVLRDAAGGEIDFATVPLQPFQHLERNIAGIFNQNGSDLGDGFNWTVETEVDAGAGPVLTYLANINASGDIFFVPGRGLD